MMKPIAALNVYKKVAIVRNATDSLTYEDSEGNTRTVSDLGQAAATATPALSSNKGPKHDIPVPQIKMVAEYDDDVPSNYKVKQSFVRYHRPSRAEWFRSIDYVADAEDETWLAANTKFGGGTLSQLDGNGKQESKNEEDIFLYGEDSGTKSNKEKETNPDVATASGDGVTVSCTPRRPRLPLDIFEHMMDILEKETAFDAIVSGGQAEHYIQEKIPRLAHLFPTKGKAGVVTVKQVVNDVYNYWIQKRSKLKRPLLRQFWPVTSTEDTNPHLVFRPREKEKYKLRRARRNDMLSFNKMKQLRNDFENLRLLLELVRKREELHRLQVQLQCELFEQKVFDMTDTSGKPRLSKPLNKRDISDALAVPAHFDMNANGGRKGKRGRKANSRSASPTPSMDNAIMDVQATAAGISTINQTGDVVPRNVAGHNFGMPAPNFLHPLQTRESYVTSWDDSVPHVTSYINAHPIPTYRFRHRPRVGRGGRLVIDRLPCPSLPDATAMTFFTAGKGLTRETKETGVKARLLDLLPEPLDYKSLSRRIEEISASALQEDVDYATTGPPAPVAASVEGDDNDGDQQLVKLDDYLETDAQVWGDERYTIGPI